MQGILMRKIVVSKKKSGDRKEENKDNKDSKDKAQGVREERAGEDRQEEKLLPDPGSAD